MAESDAKALFDQVSLATSKLTTKAYSTSFSLGINCLGKALHDPIYSIYGFVRFADEIVDSFHHYDKRVLLDEFKEDTYKSLERQISMNPILNSFQRVVHRYNIDLELIDCFLRSMEMDLEQSEHSEKSYADYILGSAEVVGLMCLKVFVDGNEEAYLQLKPFAMKLGSAFQKINFLRDLNADYTVLGRVYFPGIDLSIFSEKEKAEIMVDIEKDFYTALIGIKMLPKPARFGVYVAYTYYLELFKKIKKVPAKKLLGQRVRVSNSRKLALLFSAATRNLLNWH